MDYRDTIVLDDDDGEEENKDDPVGDDDDDDADADVQEVAPPANKNKRPARRPPPSQGNKRVRRPARAAPAPGDRRYAPWMSARHHQLLSRFPPAGQQLDADADEQQQPDLHSFVRCQATAPLLPQPVAIVPIADADTRARLQDQQRQQDFSYSWNAPGDTCVPNTTYKKEARRRGKKRSHNDQVASTKLSKKQYAANQRVFSYKIRLRPTPQQKELIHHTCAAHDTAYNLALRWLQEDLGTQVFDACTVRTPKQYDLMKTITGSDVLFGQPNPLRDKFRSTPERVKNSGVRELLAKVKSTTEAMLLKGDRGDPRNDNRFNFTMQPRDIEQRPFRSFHVVQGDATNPGVKWSAKRRSFTFYSRVFTAPIAAASKKAFRHWLELVSSSPYTSNGNSHTCIVKYERPGRYYLILPYVHTLQPRPVNPSQPLLVAALDPGVRTFQASYDNSG